MRTIREIADVEAGLAALVAADPRLVPVAAIAGPLPLRLERADFAGLASIIVSQQVSKASAAAIYGRLARLVDPLDAPRLAECGDELFRQAGLSRPKQAALLAAARAVADGRLNLDAVARMEAGAAIAAMTAVHGIGPWTAEIFLLFCAGHPDIFPAGDLALQEGVRVALELNGRPKVRDLRAIAEDWSPWRGVAARLFWAFYAALKGGRDATPL